MDKKLLARTFMNTALAAIYIFLVSQLMQNAGKLFGQKDNFFTPFVILLLFTLSAAVVGGLVFGQSVLLFSEGKNAESIKAAIYSVGWLSLYTVLGFITLLFIK